MISWVECFFQELLRVKDGSAQFLTHGVIVDGGQGGRGRRGLAEVAFRDAGKGKERAHTVGTLAHPGGEELLLEYQREGDAVEGVAHHVLGAIQQTEELLDGGGAGVAGVEVAEVQLLVHLADGQAGLPAQRVGEARALRRVQEVVEEDVALRPLPGACDLQPLLTAEEEHGVYHLHGRRAQLPEVVLEVGLTHGDAPEARHRLADEGVVGRGGLDAAHAGGIRHLAHGMDVGRTEVPRVELHAAKVLLAPDLVAAIDHAVVPRSTASAIREGGVPGQPQTTVHELLQLVLPHAAGDVPDEEADEQTQLGTEAAPTETLPGEQAEIVGMVGRPIVHERHVVPQATEVGHGGVGLEQRTVVLGTMICQNTYFHVFAITFFTP